MAIPIYTRKCANVPVGSIVLIVFPGSALNEGCDGAMNSQPPMKRKRKLTLSTFDDRLLDGMNFCHLVYELFNQTRAGVSAITARELI